MGAVVVSSLVGQLLFAVTLTVLAVAVGMLVKGVERLAAKPSSPGPDRLMADAGSQGADGGVQRDWHSCPRRGCLQKSPREARFCGRCGAAL